MSAVHAEIKRVDFSVSTHSPAAGGGARGFMAARRRRRLQLQIAPELRWERAVLNPGDPGPAPSPAWVLHLGNEGGDAADATIVLFTPEMVVRAPVGESGCIACGERWELVIADEETDHAHPIRGFVLGRGTDGRWHATTVDGRTASFRTQPDELGVLRTLGLKVPPSAAERGGVVRSALSASLPEQTA